MQNGQRFTSVLSLYFPVFKIRSSISSKIINELFSNYHYVIMDSNIFDMILSIFLLPLLLTADQIVPSLASDYLFKLAS